MQEATPIMLNESINNDEAAHTLFSEAISLITSNPCALFSVVIAYFSGQFWLYIFFTSITNKKKQDTFKKWMYNSTGRILFGVMWESLIFFILHLFYYGRTIPISFMELEELAPAVLILALALQFPVVILTNVLSRKEH